ncbi:unnamed protein product [Prunus armeniaca]
MAAPSLGHFIKHLLGICKGQVLGFPWRIPRLRGSIDPFCPYLDQPLAVRICADYRNLNEASPKYEYPMPMANMLEKTSTRQPIT